MRAAQFLPVVVFLLLFFLAAGPAAAQSGDAACTDRPNLAIASIVLDRTDYLAGAQADSVAGSVLMAELLVTVVNTGGVASAGSRLGYVATIAAPDGKTVETLRGGMEIYPMDPGGREETIISLMLGALRPLLQPSGEIVAVLTLRVEVDVDEQIRECLETDNAGSFTGEIRTEKVVQ